jgi:hypothetical protein
MTIEESGITLLGAELAALVPALQPSELKRFPVIRTKLTEERAEIPYKDRREVYARDSFRCVWCQSRNRLTLDHIIPWSAGGSDDIENLRTLCWSCNESRSNFKIPADELAPRLPLTFCCIDCDPDGFAIDHPSVEPCYCHWCKHVALGSRAGWCKENNAFWDYDLNWHRNKYPGWTRKSWEDACLRLKFPSRYAIEPPTEDVRRALVHLGEGIAAL